jgi:subtilisin
MLSRTWLIPTQVLAVVAFLFGGAVQARAQSGHYIVSFRTGTSHAARAAAVARAGGRIRFNYSLVEGAAITVPNANALQRLQQDAAVQSIIPDREVFAIQLGAQAAGKGKPGGGGSAQIIPEGVKRVGKPTSSSNGEGIGVAIVDTGIDFAHSDLSPASEAFSSQGSSCQDDNGHGTHVTGIVAALDNSTGVVGVAPKSKPYCVKVLNANGSGEDSDVIAGLDWVYDHRSGSAALPRIGVVNMSLGRPGTLDDNPLLHGAIKKLYDAGIVVVVAAGNDPNLEVSQQVPATYPEVLAIASTTAIAGTNRCVFFSGVIGADTASYFTSDGAFNGETGVGVTISAPGEDQENISNACLIQSVGILSTRLGGGTIRLSGTSMAAPHIAGVVARLLQLGTAGVENIRAFLRATATNSGLAPFDSPTIAYSFDGEREGVGHVN